MQLRRMWGRGARQGKAELGSGLCPLTDLQAGMSGIVRQIRGGREFVGRVAGMGIAVGAVLRVVQNCRGVPVLVEVRETRLALGRGEAVKILVEPHSEG